MPYSINTNRPWMQQVEVDEQDERLLSQYTWSLKDGTRLYTKIKNKTVYLHHMMFGNNRMYDHADQNPLNNKRSNLREATKSQNSMNRPMHADNTSGYKGIKKNGRNWLARIQVAGKSHHLGTFTSKEEAALNYDIAAKKYHKEFASLNFNLELR